MAIDEAASDPLSPGRPRVELRELSGHTTIVQLIGEHDLSQAELVKDVFDVAAARRRNVLVDFSRCEFFDSTLVMLLLHGQASVEALDRHFALVIPAQATQAARTAEMMAFVQFFPVYATLKDARAAVEHVTHVQDKRARIGERERFVAECACGWHGETHTGLTAWRAATSEARDHRGGLPRRPRSPA